MSRHYSKKPLAALCSLAILLAICRAADATDFVREVAAGVFVHQGVTVPFTDPQHDDIANIGFIVGDHCVAVIDTGGSLAIGRALRAAVERHTDRPICYVINTHLHPDHVLGNAVFRDTDAVFVGHHRLAQGLLRNREFFSKNFSADIAPLGEDALVLPDRTVEDTLELDLGGRILHLRALPVAHTDTDLSIWDRSSSTLWLGLVFVERIPALDGSLRGWVEVLEQLRSQTATRVIPGNGPAPAPWPDAVEPQLRYLHRLIDDTRVVLAEGGFLEDALRRVGMAEQGHWLLFDQHHQSNVIRAFAELEWE